MSNVLYGFLIIFWFLIIIGGGTVVSIIYFIDVLVENSINEIIVLVIKGVVITLIIFGWVALLQKMKNKILKNAIKFT
ncbi:MAG: hypothetical protein R1F52_02300 [Candidatus Nitrosoabyssus spongiisocia]|nr:MAG: hypothetical protein R1F52_02300 [Nitrosopumilaceae archaeon AB1(1)]